MIARLGREPLIGSFSRHRKSSSIFEQGNEKPSLRLIVIKPEGLGLKYRWTGTRSEFGYYLSLPGTPMKPYSLYVGRTQLRHKYMPVQAGLAITDYCLFHVNLPLFGGQI